MNSTRLARLCLLVTCVFAPLSAQAQGPGASLQARVAALEALVATLQSDHATLDGRVGKLESGEFDEADLVGTYRAHVFAIDLTGDPAKVQTETSVGTFTLNPDNTASISGMGIHCRLQQSTPWFVECDEPEIADAVSGTWSVQDGSILVQVGGEDAFGGVIGAGGRVIISGGTANLTEIPDRTPEIYSPLLIAIRLPNP
jgi:hypothetical protein